MPTVDIRGQRFGRLSVMMESGRDKYGQTLWRCHCDCGADSIVLGCKLRHGHTKSCGCLKDLRIDLAGQVYDRLTVLRLSHKTKNGGSMWLCVCACGKECIVRGDSLRRGLVRSCGCLQREKARQIASGQQWTVLHGHTKHKHQTPTYRSWMSMIQRCTNPNHDNYPRYGGANPPVKVCDRWLHSFEAFLADKGERPEGTTLGRFMDMGDYTPENTAWMTWAEQRTEARKKKEYLKHQEMAVAA